MHNELFIASVVCPICEKNFPVIKAKTTAYKLDRTDEDFCMHYRELNPLLYEVWICPHCGYAEIGTQFDKISPIEKTKVSKFCLNKFLDDPLKNPFELTDYHKAVYSYFDKLGFEGDRDDQSAIDSFKILLLNYDARKAPDSLKAKAALRIGWMYRFMKEPAELGYLEIAADYFASAFETESLEEGKFDAATCAYMAGELYRRVNNSVKSLDWFRKALTAAQSTDNKSIAEKTRDQVQVLKSGM